MSPRRSRRSTVPERELFLQPGVPDGLCPSAILSVSAGGRIIPCCNTAGHLPALEVGTIDQPLEEVHQKFLKAPHIRVMVEEGPKALLDAAVEGGYQPRTDGYVDQCHLCYEMFQDERVAESVKRRASEIVERKQFESLLQQFERNLAAGDGGAGSVGTDHIPTARPGDGPVAATPVGPAPVEVSPAGVIAAGCLGENRR